MTSLFDSLLVFICAMLLISCAKLTVEGGTTHRVEGHAVVEQRITIDFAVCDKIIDETERSECVIKIIDLIEKVDPPTNVTGTN